jgi:ketol-acid reductoisomerase
MIHVYFDKDADLSYLDDFTIGMIGYGNQAQAQALNLKDSGFAVRVGTAVGSAARAQAFADGFANYSVEEVAANCAVMIILLEDSVITDVYVNSIEPYLEAHEVFIFGHSHVVRQKSIRLPDDADIILLSAEGTATQLREKYLAGSGLPALLSVEQDASGIARARALAYVKALGCTKAGVSETTFSDATTNTPEYAQL